jgi:hypothetical protein
MKTNLLNPHVRTAAGISLLAFTATLLPEARAHRIPDEPPVVQIALLLDTSNSMDGLIKQAKTQLWRVVNQFGNTKCRGNHQPAVEVALFEYGNDSLSEGSRWIRCVVPFSRDLDRISEDLFSLSTNGGSEYCGAVIRRAVEALDWSHNPDSYKAIFIAGNEHFTQGPVNFRSTCRSAAHAGITVNTIHCGSERDGIAGCWREGARLGGGDFMTINQDSEVTHIHAPQDERIAQLNEKLNDTYIVYGGSAGQRRKTNQVTQDDNASEVGSLVSRVVSKATTNYTNHSWDLVDASKQEGFDIAALPAASLPEEMQKLTSAQRAEHVEQLAAERKTIQKEILELNREREAFVSEQLKQQGETETVGAAMVRAIRSQAAKKGLILEK